MKEKKYPMNMHSVYIYINRFIIYNDINTTFNILILKDK